MNEDLQQIGFSKHEADVYLALVEIGSTGAGEIIKRTSLHRNIVYVTLDRLVAKGLVTQFKSKNIAQFKADNPENILLQVRRQLEVASQLVPLLAKKAAFTQDVTIYEGAEGFQTFNFKILENANPGEEFYIIGTGTLWYEIMGDTYPKWLRLWNKKGVRGKSILYMPSKRNEEVPRYETKLIKQVDEPPADMMIWGDNIALQTFVEPYTVIHIRNKTLSSAYKKYFDLIWKEGSIKEGDDK